jgi:signal transduction histidine kinase
MPDEEQRVVGPAAEQPEPQDDGQSGPSSDSFPLERIQALLGQLQAEHAPDAAWELGLCVDALSDTLKERTARLKGLQEESRQLQARITREHQEYVELRASMDELLDLSELSETISSSFDIHDIMAALMKLSARVLEYESGGVFVREADEDDLRPAAITGDEQLSDLVRGLWEDGIIDWVSREGRAVVIEDMNSLDQPGVTERSFVIIPLRVRGRDLGVYTLHCPRAKDDYTAGQIDLLGVLASQTAIAMDNARLYNDLDTAHRRLQESQSQILLSSKLAAVGELAGGVAHEVNNPLQIILSRVQLMMIQDKSSQRTLQGLGLIETNVKRISRIIRALLGFAGHNIRDEEWAPVNIPEALQQAWALIEHQLDKNLITTRLDCEEGMPQLVGHVGELEQVFINLMMNAQNAMPNGGELHICARQDAELIEIRFSDSGTGIAPEHIERIFEPFFTTRGGSGGTGLGLAVSYGIIEMHRGTITVESELGQGASFVIRLPLAPPPPAADAR